MTPSDLAHADPRDLKRTLVIEQVAPAVDAGRHAVKRVVGDVVEVSADIFKEGHDVLQAWVLWRPAADPAWRETPMRFVDNDRWAGQFPLEANTRYRFTVEAVADPYLSWLVDLRKRVEAGQDVAGELREGLALIREAAARADAAGATGLSDFAGRLQGAASQAEALAIARDAVLVDLMTTYVDRSTATRAGREYEIVADRERARFAAWYEFFPRSGVAGRHATLKDAEAMLERAAALGFDVAYLPPIHPVGRTSRKGRNNSLTAGPGDPGSVWAIGSEEGGHTAVNPELGTLADFDRFVERARELGLEIALDFAIQCSPDHPWVREHPEWFFHRPDGTIKYAENPPKKYEDVYFVNFYGPDPRPLWEALRQIVEFWIGHGVRIFRVDNPHTKPVVFWEWLIRQVQTRHPDVIFLSEAFTRPKMMQVLAKVGFTQSYTYFTWRNDKEELAAYLSEITRPPVSDYFRGNLWPNTPDILHATLVQGGRPAFRQRLVLAATLSSLYGVYSGYELSENVPLREDSEEYRDSEKYELKARDWEAPGNITDLVVKVNRFRREHPALQQYANLRFHRADDPYVLFYGKTSADRRDAVFVAATLDLSGPRAVRLELPLGELGLSDDQPYQLHERITDTWLDCRGRTVLVTLDPAVEPAAIYSLHR
jgi:starch synthase (maltosyl-transferring)